MRSKMVWPKRPCRSHYSDAGRVTVPISQFEYIGRVSDGGGGGATVVAAVVVVVVIVGPNPLYYRFANPFASQSN